MVPRKSPCRNLARFLPSNLLKLVLYFQKCPGIRDEHCPSKSPYVLVSTESSSFFNDFVGNRITRSKAVPRYHANEVTSILVDGSEIR